MRVYLYVHWYTANHTRTRRAECPVDQIPFLQTMSLRKAMSQLVHRIRLYRCHFASLDRGQLIPWTNRCCSKCCFCSCCSSPAGQVHQDMLRALLSSTRPQHFMRCCRMERSFKAVLFKDAQEQTNGKEGRYFVRAPSTSCIACGVHGDLDMV